ncbi:hypothetical protein D3C86_1484900 [compost metagenome]
MASVAIDAVEACASAKPLNVAVNITPTWPKWLSITDETKVMLVMVNVTISASLRLNAPPTLIGWLVTAAGLGNIRLIPYNAVAAAPDINGPHIWRSKPGSTAPRIKPTCVTVAKLDRIAAALRILILSGCRATRWPMAAIVTVLEANPEAMALIAYP